MEQMRDYEFELLNVLRARRLCQSTIDGYKTLLRQYLGWCYSNGIYTEDMPHEGLVQFMAEAKSESSSGVRRALLVNLYEFVLGQGFKLYNLPYAKVRVKIPESLSPNEIIAIFNSISHPKQRLILKIIYALGLRVSESVTLHTDNFRQKLNTKTGQKYFEYKVTGKGNKERLIPIPEHTMNEIQNYMEDNQIDGYLFKGQFRECYSVKSVQNVFNRAKITCGIKANGSVHLLRKSRTAHLLDGNMNDRNVMLMFGWVNAKTVNHYHKANTSAIKDGVDNVDALIFKAIENKELQYQKRIA